MAPVNNLVAPGLIPGLIQPAPRMILILFRLIRVLMAPIGITDIQYLLSEEIVHYSTFVLPHPCRRIHVPTADQIVFLIRSLMFFAILFVDV